MVEKRYGKEGNSRRGRGRRNQINLSKRLEQRILILSDSERRENESREVLWIISLYKGERHETGRKKGGREGEKERNDVMRRLQVLIVLTLEKNRFAWIPHQGRRL